MYLHTYDSRGSWPTSTTPAWLQSFPTSLLLTCNCALSYAFPCRIAPYWADWIVWQKLIFLQASLVRNLTSFQAMEMVHSHTLRAALVTYEYLITIDQEITLIWRRKWSFVTLLYVLNRYLVLLASILQVAPAQPIKVRYVERVYCYFCSDSFPLSGMLPFDSKESAQPLLLQT